MTPTRRTVVHILGWGAGLGLGAVFLLGYLGAYVAPDRVWWIDPLAVVLPATSLLLLGVVAASWAARRRSSLRGALAAAVLLAVAIRFGPSLPHPFGIASGHEPRASTPASPDSLDAGALDAGADSGSDPTADGPTADPEAGPPADPHARPPAEPAGGSGVLRLMTFNIPHVGGDPAELSGATARAVRAERPHLLALQEPHVVTGRGSGATVRRVSPQLRRLVGASGYELPNDLPPGSRLQQPVLARAGVDDLVPDRLERPPGHPFASRVSFRWRGRRAVLYNVHLHTTVGGHKPWKHLGGQLFDPEFWAPVLRTYRTGARRRAQQARRLRRMIEQESDPVIVVGDFNSTRHHWVYRHIARGLHDAHRTAGRGFGGTFPADWPLVRIDHVLVGDAWEVVGAHVSPDHAASDHRPVLTQLRWSDEAGGEERAHRR